MQWVAATATAKTGFSVAAGSGLNEPPTTNDQKCPILTTILKNVLVTPKECKPCFLSVIPEVQTQPMEKRVTQVEVDNDQKTQRTIVFGPLWPKTLDGGNAKVLSYFGSSRDSSP